MFLDRRCPGCRDPARRLCPRCLDALARRWPPVGSGAAAALGLDGLTALCRYGPWSRQAVLAAKNGGRGDVLRQLGSHLHPPPGLEVEVVTWVPASRGGRARRGYDQGQVLARALAHRLDVPARRLLGRRGGGAQTGANRAQRLAGPEVVALGPCPRGVLVVDDVCTTGTSLARSTAQLRQAGAVSVGAAVLALAPGKSLNVSVG